MKANELVHSALGELVSVEELKSKASIDINNLVDECAKQPYYYGCASCLAAEFQNAFRKAKAHFELTKAAVESEIRAHPEQYGLSKVTDNAVANLVSQQTLVLEARDLMNEANSHMDLANVLVGIFEQKRSMLNNEVQLLSCNYIQSAPLSSRSAVETKEREIAKLRGENHGEGT